MWFFLTTNRHGLQRTIDLRRTIFWNEYQKWKIRTPYSEPETREGLDYVIIRDNWTPKGFTRVIQRKVYLINLTLEIERFFLRVDYILQWHL